MLYFVSSPFFFQRPFLCKFVQSDFVSMPRSNIELVPAGENFSPGSWVLRIWITLKIRTVE